MVIKIIENEAEYEQYLSRIEEIFDAPAGSAEAKELELLVLLVNKYEEEHYPIDEPDPIAYIKVRMEELGLKDKDLVPYMGDKGTVSKVLSGKRGLSLEMIRKLSRGLRFPVEVLIG